MLITKLENMNSTTVQENDTSYCQTKRLSVVIVLQKHVGDGTQNTVRDKSNELLHKWNLDPKCNKTMVMLIATEDHKFWAARGDKFPFTGPEITAIFMQQKKNFASGDYAQALENILDSIINKDQQLPIRDTTINQSATTTELISTNKTESETEAIQISPTVGIILIIVIILLILCFACLSIVSQILNICSGRGLVSSMFSAGSNDVDNRQTNSNPTPVLDQGGGGDFSSSGGGDKESDRGAVPQFIEWTVPQPNTSPIGHFPTEQLIDHGQFIDQKCLK
uniref:TPM domain-containing protein n=1 Tax=Acrobeloides nanus TaxID=290746 RepID=A0A914DZX6_9BILA